MSTSQSRTAIRIIKPGVAEIDSSVPYPSLRPDYIIAEARAFALNATDNHQIDELGGTGTIIGCDWSGVVREVGEKVTRFKPGDSVYGICHGGNTVQPEDGAFADIITSKEHCTMHKPDFLSFEEAASLGVGLATIGQVLYWVMDLPLPSPEIPVNSGPTLLVYGGSSLTGTIAIQAAKLSGFRVFTTCSPENKNLVQSRGADEWFDYNEPDCYKKIQETGESISYIADCLGTEDSSTFCSKILSPSGGHYHSIKAPIPEAFKALLPEETAIATTSLAYAMSGEGFEFPGMKFPADPAQGDFAKKWFLIAENLVASRKIQPHPVLLGTTRGLEGVLEGLKKMRKSGPRGHKIVYSRDAY